MFTSLKGRLIATALVATWLSNSLLFLFLSTSDWLLLLLVLTFSGLFVVAIVHYFFTFIENKIIALEAGLLNFKDNEFSNSLAITGTDELSELCYLYNDVADKLRAEKQSIYQRELLLDKVIESSPIMMFLVDDDDYFVYSNSETRHFLNQGKRMEGEQLTQLMKCWPKTLCQAITEHQDGLFVIEEQDNSETWHLSRGDFLLNNKGHQLFLLKQMTRELNRQEVAVWKKVIRVISHELNNSLAPISSVTHSGQLIAKKYQDNKLPLIFDTIKERIDHLNSFISGYAKFAKLPTPRLEPINIKAFVEQLQTQLEFNVPEKIANVEIMFDPSQLEQVMINLIKNAQESGSALSQVSLNITVTSQQAIFEINDRGAGMSEQVLTNALIPFYSTKQSGTGLGLALCREIIEAHDGKISLHNRVGGGLAVSVSIPIK
ncbi:ATP-binding protein [Thalassotalea sp. 1_MG-2023]|uniref:sensor histidine kinase n=1 Tax=Thalassotalea sp. 1_MG-2023 TaxID=3062680 RepID=UPI0026E36726|nr:ATP-binding protein [Thalassotalea sp. 1_MG-2023]MDO6428342.1 ATP-binding protein [Thalassotalea sp. 1_MG-2023]